MRNPHSVQKYGHFQLKSKQSQLCNIENDHNFEQNEDCATVILKWMRTLVISNFCKLQIKTYCQDQRRHLKKMGHYAICNQVQIVLNLARLAVLNSREIWLLQFNSFLFLQFWKTPFHIQTSSYSQKTCVMTICFKYFSTGIENVLILQSYTL